MPTPPRRRDTPYATPTRRAPARPSAYPGVALAVSALLTLAAASVVLVTGQARDEARFETAAQATRDRIAAQLDTYVAMLYGARGLFEAAEALGRPTSRAAFRAYVAQLDLARRFPGVRGIGVSWRVRAESRDSLVRAVRADGVPDFRLWPDSARPDVHAIIYLEPLDRRNRAALGFDMFADSTRRAAMLRAATTGAAAISGKVVLVQEIDAQKQLGFLIYVPIYRKSTPPELDGFVYSPFRVDQLFRGTVAGERAQRVAFRVYDGPRADTAALLFDSWRGRGPQPAPTFTKTERMPVAGGEWTMVFDALPVSEPFSGRVLAFGILLLGTLVTAAIYLSARAQVRAQRAAEQSAAARSRFFAAMSHELRTPINAIIGYNDLMLAEVFGPLGDPQRAGLERSQRAAKHLQELVSDVLDLSKLEAGKVDLELVDVDLRTLLEELLATVRPVADARDCPLSLDYAASQATIHTDPRRLRQILLNLVSNATKFGGGSPVEMRCVSVSQSAVAIEVRDRGPGIPPEDRERIFEEFVQLRDTPAGGTGLGLTISLSLARLLGGRLEVDSRVGEGSTFRLTLPVRGPAHGARPEARGIAIVRPGGARPAAT